MSDPKLTLSFCLRAIADNIDKGCLYLRVGPVLLDYDGVENEYHVHDKDGKTECFVDLVEAINHFIGCVLSM
jgi:hypothetical protein